MSPTTTATKQAAVTIGEFINHVLSGVGTGTPFWPPDVFAVAAALLHKSGAYGFVLDHWPPSIPPGQASWQGYVRTVSQEWRMALTTSSGSAPAEIAVQWVKLCGFGLLAIQSIRDSADLCETLLKLCAISDEACWGFGIPASKQLEKVRRELVNEPIGIARKLAIMTQPLLQGGKAGKANSGSTLCRTIHPSRLRVLPKLHIPQAGFTIRSFSRNLALCTGDEIRPSWNLILREPGEESVNLLLIPWPKEVRPAQFGSAAGRSAIGEDRHGLFVWRPETTGPPKEQISAILDRAERLAGPIGGVVLPELALTKDQYESVHDALLEKTSFVVAGIAEEGANGAPAKNYLSFEMRLTDESPSAASAPGNPNSSPVKALRFAVEQSKHHRWLLDKSQILQYGLGSVLSPRRSWWEDLAIQDRALHFFAMRDWLTMSVLICEDLARPDPVGDLVRAVGPNLVIALLMDGPQLASRWAGRYATVLADDPGCSVLSLTSIGMCKLSRPPSVKSGSRVVALWKDAKSGTPVEIELPEGADAIVLSLTVAYMEEWTADGRTDAGTTGYPVLGGIHPIFPSA